MSALQNAMLDFSKTPSFENLEPWEQKFLRFLVDKCWRTNKCSYKQTTLALEYKCTREWVGRLLRSLVSKNVLIESRNGIKKFWTFAFFCSVSSQDKRTQFSLYNNKNNTKTKTSLETEIFCTSIEDAEQQKAKTPPLSTKNEHLEVATTEYSDYQSPKVPSLNKKPVPQNYQPTWKHKEFAERHGINLERERRAFITKSKPVWNLHGAFFKWIEFGWLRLKAWRERNKTEGLHLFCKKQDTTQKPKIPDMTGCAERNDFDWREKLMREQMKREQVSSVNQIANFLKIGSRV